MKYQQPAAPNSPPKEANALEMAVYDYQKKAHEFHLKRCKSAPVNETAEQREKRIAEWDEISSYLEQERLKVSTLADIEQQLEEYRKKAWGKSRAELMKEKYHRNSVLPKNLAANGEPKPTMKHSAHHIVPGTGRWMQNLLYQVRLKLHSCGIGINDPLNGVWLIQDRDHHGHGTTQHSAKHPDTYGWNYEHWIITQLRFLSVTPPNKNEYQTTPNNNSPFVARLIMLKSDLKNGAYPIKITEGKDISWDGKA